MQKWLEILLKLQTRLTILMYNDCVQGKAVIQMPCAMNMQPKHSVRGVSMAKYTVTVAPKGVNQGLEYSCNLEQVFEDDPKQLFTHDFCEELRTHLQSQGQYRITDEAVGVITREWSADIGLGYRESWITLDLMPLDYIDPYSFEDEIELALPEPLFPDLEPFIQEINLTVLPHLDLDPQN